MKCYKCYEEIEDDSKFCGFCGVNIREAFLEQNNSEEVSDVAKVEGLDIVSDEVCDDVLEENTVGTNIKDLTKEKNIEEKILDELERSVVVGTIPITQELDGVRETEEGRIIKENISETITSKQATEEVNEVNLVSEVNAIEENEEYNELGNNDNQVQKSNLSVLKKIIIAVVIINILLGFGGVLYLRHENDPQNTVNNFIEALSNSDYDKLSKVALPKDSNLSLSEKSGQALFNLYNKNITAKEKINSILSEELLRRKSGLPLDDTTMVSLIEEKHGLYSTYKIGIQDYDISLKSNISNVKVLGFENDVQIEKDSNDIVVKDVLLGRYNINATSTDDYGVTYTYEDYLDSLDSKIFDLKFRFTDIEIRKPEFEITNIYVNEKPYSNLNFTNDVLKISPIPYDSEVKVECRTTWGGVLTSSYKTNNPEGFNIFTPKFILDDSTKTTLMNIGCEFYKNMYTYFNDRDTDSLEKMNYRNNIGVVDSLTSSIKNINENKKYGYYSHTYTVSNLAADKEFINEDIALGEFSIYIEATLDFKSVYYNKDGKVEEDRGSSSKNNKGYEFKIKNINGNWIVTGIDYSFRNEIKQIYNYNN